MWKTDTLTLYAEYEECGEWGGHRETFKIFKKDNGGLWAKYKKDTLTSCDPYLGRNRKITKEQKIKLTEGNQEKITNYIRDLLDGTLEETPLGNSAEQFRIYNTDSTILILRFAHGYKEFDRLRDSIIK
jgi:hypothetical protein